MEKDIEYRIKRFLDECEDGNWYWDDGVDAIENLIKGYRELEKEIEILREYIIIAPNLDEMTALKYAHIQESAYFRGRAEEQQRANETIHKHFIPKSKIKEKIEELKNYDSEFCQRVINHNEHTLTEFVQNILQELMEDK